MREYIGEGVGAGNGGSVASVERGRVDLISRGM